MSNVTHIQSAQADDPEFLATELLALKRTKADIDKRIGDIEQAIIAKIGAKEEGSFTVESDHYRFTTTGKQYRKVDESGLTDLRKVVSRTIFNKVFRTKHELNLSEYRYIANNEPEIFAEIAKVVTTTPGKTALKVEAI